METPRRGHPKERRLKGGVTPRRGDSKEGRPKGGETLRREHPKGRRPQGGETPRKGDPEEASHNSFPSRVAPGSTGCSCLYGYDCTCRKAARAQRSLV